MIIRLKYNIINKNYILNNFKYYKIRSLKIF